jgi:Asp-tRNA(Asn)/Glu-tRNA(Gln) amidotransferase A subunit family amidase
VHLDEVLDRVLRGADASGRLHPDPAAGFLEDVANRFEHHELRGQNAPIKTVDEVLRSGNYHPSVQVRLQAAQAVTQPPEDSPGCKAREAMRERFRKAVTAMMDSLHLDALVYPTWSNPPRLIGDLNTPAGDNSQLFSPTTGFPAITVPMGYTRNNTLPAGITFFGRAWSEGELIKLAYAYEQLTKHRKPPASTRGK